MIKDFLTFIRDTGDTICEAFVLPGNYVMSNLVVHAPWLAEKLGVNSDDGTTAIPVILSLVIWIVLAILVSVLVKAWQNLVRVVGSIIRTISFRISLALRNFKTTVVCKLRRLWPRRRSSFTYATPTVEFDDLDLAVLRCASAQGPAFALSAPDLAEQFTLRPAQVQRSLDKLNKNKMLDYVIGSTDGFDNYRLTDSGAAFFAMLQRQQTNSI